MVHIAYAKRAQLTFVSLEEYEAAKRAAEQAGSVVLFEPAAEQPKVA